MRMTLSDMKHSDLCMTFLHTRFPDDVISNVRTHYKTITCRVSNQPLSKIYEQFLPNQKLLGLKDFSVAETSLDEVIQIMNSRQIILHTLLLGVHFSI